MSVPSPARLGRRCPALLRPLVAVGREFPSDRFTVLDLRHNALLRPNCAVRVSDCADLDMINTLEGCTRNAAGGYTQVFTLLG